MGGIGKTLMNCQLLKLGCGYMRVIILFCPHLHVDVILKVKHVHICVQSQILRK